VSSLSGVRWRKSTLSGVENCVEVAFLGDQVLTRDSKDADGPPQVYDRAEWAAFIAGVKAGEFDA
jgi:uncharacterized protein DUF397